MPDPTLAVVGGVSVVVLLACSAFFSSAETAVLSLPIDWVDAQTGSGDPRATALAALRDDPHRLLVTILVGNNLVNVAVTSVATVVLSAYVPAGIAVSVATLGVTCLLLVFGEIVPKSYGLGNARRWALTVARPLSLVERILSPLITVFDVVTRRIAARIGGESDIEKPYVD